MYTDAKKEIWMNHSTYSESSIQFSPPSSFYIKPIESMGVCARVWHTRIPNLKRLSAHVKAARYAQRYVVQRVWTGHIIEAGVICSDWYIHVSVKRRAPCFKNNQCVSITDLLWPHTTCRLPAPPGTSAVLYYCKLCCGWNWAQIQEMTLLINSWNKATLRNRSLFLSFNSVIHCSISAPTCRGQRWVLQSQGRIWPADLLTRF